MFVLAAVHGLAGHLPPASTAGQPVHRTVAVGGGLTVLLTLRAFASGCTALTGGGGDQQRRTGLSQAEAAQRRMTLAMMGLLAVSMFIGITVLALHLSARAQPSGNPSVISQIAAAVFGGHAVLFYLYQAATAGILVLAANTAFNGFPVLASILADDRYLPRQLHNRGEKLVFSNGILLLGGFAIALIAGVNLVGTTATGVLDSPYREITRRVLDYVRGLRRRGPRDVVTVFIPEYVVGYWWEHLLHNQSALQGAAALRAGRHGHQRAVAAAVERATAPGVAE
jgi:amino acid transporter